MVVNKKPSNTSYSSKQITTKMGDRGATNRSNATSRIKKLVNEIPFFCKIIELIVCVVVVGLIVDPFKDELTKLSLDHAGIIYVSICGYVLINTIIILCYLLGERQPKRMSMIFSVVGGILCCASGIVLIHNWNHLHDSMISYYNKQYSNQMIASGIFAILASAVFTIDAFITYKHE